MKQKILPYLALIIFLAVTVLSQLRIEKSFSYPYSLKPAPLEKYALLDLTSVLFGVRKLGADIAWIQLLQYYGTPEGNFTEEEKWQMYGPFDPNTEKHGEQEGATGHEEHEHSGYGPQGKFYGSGQYFEFLKLSQRVIRLDPYLEYVYLFSSASLAWNLERPDEGIQLLDEGIANMPNSWKLYLYKQAIIYKKADRYAEMVSSLEKAIEQPDCPDMVKSILANIYKKQGNYRRAAEIWMKILENPNSSYYNYAKQQIENLSKAF